MSRCARWSRRRGPWTRISRSGCGGGGQLDRLVDEAHAAIVEAIVSRLRAAGWTVEVEVEVLFAIWGERGSIDVLAFHAARGALLVIEVKSAITDSQATIHGLDRKARLAREIAGGRGWDVRHVSRLLVVGATDRARRRIAGLAATYDAELPMRGSTVRRWLRDPERALAAGLLFVSFDAYGRFHRRRQAARDSWQISGLAPVATSRRPRFPLRAQVRLLDGLGDRRPQGEQVPLRLDLAVGGRRVPEAPQIAEDLLTGRAVIR